MPLKKGKSRAVVGKNIAEMEAAGHPAKQAIAASLREARVSADAELGATASWDQKRDAKLCEESKRR